MEQTTSNHSGLQQPAFCFLSRCCGLTGLSWAVLWLHVKSAGAAVTRGLSGACAVQDGSVMLLHLYVACGWVPRSSVPGVSIPKVPGRNCKTPHDSALKSQAVPTVLVKQVTENPRSKGTCIAPLSLVEVFSLHVWRKGQLRWVQELNWS